MIERQFNFYRVLVAFRKKQQTIFNPHNKAVNIERVSKKKEAISF